MNIKEAINTIKEKKPIVCTQKEYKTKLRQAISDFANEAFDNNERELGMFAMNEIHRLNLHFRDEDDKQLGEANHKVFLKEEKE